MVRLEQGLRLLQGENYRLLLNVAAGSGGEGEQSEQQSTFEEHMNSGLRFDLCSLRRQCLPEDVVDAHDALRLRVATVINHSSLGFYPDVASVLSQHAVLTAHCLTLGTHCRHGREEDRFML